MTSTGKAVFFRYASEEAIAAEKFCTALRSAGIEVWFDNGEIRGGDAWDAPIRQPKGALRAIIPELKFPD